MNCRRVFSGEFIADGVPEYIDFPTGCQKGGGYKKKPSKKNSSIKKRKKKQKRTLKRVPSKRKKVMKTKKVDLIIETICKNMKSKCTPKYKKILRKLVVKNM